MLQEEVYLDTSTWCLLGVSHLIKAYLFQFLPGCLYCRRGSGWPEGRHPESNVSVVSYLT